MLRPSPGGSRSWRHAGHAVDAAARGPVGVWQRSIQPGAVSGKRAGGHDLIKPALAGNPGELERTREVIRHVCASVKAELNSPPKGTVVQAVTVRDRAAGAAGLTLSDIPAATPPKTT